METKDFATVGASAFESGMAKMYLENTSTAVSANLH